jgi:Ca2+-binding EF-hand superfamily protein
MNIKKGRWVLTSAGVLLLGLAAQTWASSPQNLPPEPKDDQEVVARFKAADLNGDGKVTREEAEKGLPRIAMAWDKVDVDKRGYITLEQLLFIANSNK